MGPVKRSLTHFYNAFTVRRHNRRKPIHGFVCSVLSKYSVCTFMSHPEELPLPGCNPSSQTPFSADPGAPAPTGIGAWLLRLYAPVSMVIGLGTLALLCLAWLPFAMLIGFLPLSGGWRRRIGRGAIFVCLRFYVWVLRLFCFIRLDVEAIRPLRHERSLVIIANHPSLIDAVLFMAYLPNTVCVMKAALQNNILFGAATRLAHYVSNASPLHMIRQASGELQRGAHLVIFPESTRTTRWPINRCSAASALMAQHAHAPIQEIYIDMNVPYLGKHWPLFRPPVLPWRIALQAGRRIEAGQFPAAAIASQFEQDVRAHFDARREASHE